MSTIIINLGMDVHTTNYTFCCYTFYNDTFFAETSVAPDFREVLKYMDTVRKAQKLSTGADVRFVCGYEAGCLGYTLYHQLVQTGHECVIPAPSTVPSFRTGEIKTDKRDARKLAQCLMGIRTCTALAVVVETGDFRRFASAEQYASCLGITPGERSSGESRHRTGITRAGNAHIRRLLVEAAQGYGRGRVGYKSKALKARQSGSSTETIAYADRANERLQLFPDSLSTGTVYDLKKFAGC